MTDESTALAAEFLHTVFERERRHDHPDTLPPFKAAYQRLVEITKRCEFARKNQFLHALADGFARADSNWAFGTIATMCGIIVENGGDPTIALEPILDRLTLQLARVPEFVSLMQQHLSVEHPNRVAPGDWQALGGSHPEFAWVIGEWFALNFVGGAAMTILSRNIEARKRARERISLIHAAQSARSDQPYGYYLAELLGMADDERLLVIDTTRKVGYRIRLMAVRNNFHLFTLLQEALNPNDVRLNSLAVAIAKSERMLPSVSPSEWATHGEQDAAMWSFHTWMAMKSDSTLQESQQQPHWIWGEMKPTEIPALDGERIVLFGPLNAARSWDVANFVPLHSALRSGVQIEETLSDAFYAAWMQRIRATAAG